jgi:hypothetical protein
MEVTVEKNKSQLILGILLVAGGIIFLLQNLGFAVFGALSAIIWAVLFGVGGVAFIIIFSQNREHWWSLIPGMALLSIGGLILLGGIAPRVADAVGGSLVLGGIGLSFGLIYLNDRQHWWAVIPGGVLATLAVVALADNLFRASDSGALFFVGLALTFGFLALLPIDKGERMRWPLIPALICLSLAVLSSTAMTAVISFVWPFILIGVGVYLLWRPKTAVATEKQPPKGEGAI